MFVLLQQRAREVVEWRSQEEEQQKLQEEQSAIQLKQKLHQEEYRLEREGLTHLSWRQRRVALYRANKDKFFSRPSERTQSEQLSLPLIIKGMRAACLGLTPFTAMILTCRPLTSIR